MKQILSLLLVATMMLGASAILSSCGLFTAKTGTEAAKLLLANERLDEDLFDDHIDLGLGFAHDQKPSEKKLSNTTPKSPTLMSLAQTKPLANETPTYTWSDFPAYTSTLMQFEAFVINIDAFALRVAEDIITMKENVGIVDKWVQKGDSKQMLRVYESGEVLIVDGESEDNVYYRHTDENANNIYEMYAFTHYEDGTSGEIRMMLVPGERYEYMYDNSGGFTDYVIMEKSRGYWICTRFNYNNDVANGYEGGNFTSIIIKDGLCYSADLTVSSDRPDVTGGYYSVVDIHSQRELIGTSISPDAHFYTLHLSAIKDGLVWVGSDSATNLDGQMMGEVTTLKTTKGTYQQTDTMPGEGINFTGGNVSYDFLEACHNGFLYFNDSMPGKTMDERFADFETYLTSIGLTLHRDMDDILAATKHAKLYGDLFASQFEWNGYLIKDFDSYKAALSALHQQYDAAFAEFEKVKDFETVDFTFSMASLPDFADLLDLSITGENTYADGYIHIADLRAAIADETLLENGEDYVLKVALSLCDEDGNFVSVNTLPLSGGEGVSVSYAGEKMTLATKGSYAVPKNLNHGNYAVVVYVATAEEGIRVSEMLKIGSFSTYDEKLTSAAMDITVKTTDAYLYIQYAIKNSHTFEVSATKDNYTYGEIERMLLSEALKYGAPFAGAKLEYEDGSSVAEDDTLGAGTYRIMAYLNTEDGLAQSYIYLTLNG